MGAMRMVSPSESLQQLLLVMPVGMVELTCCVLPSLPGTYH